MTSSLPFHNARGDYPHRHAFCILAVMVTSILFAAIPACAEPITFTAEVDGAARVATVESRAVEGVDYVPLLELVEQLGGGYELLFSRVQIDIGGHRAYVPFNERSIDGGSSQFNLLQPIIRNNGVVMIARQDVTTLFGRGFEVVVTDQRGPTASVPIGADLEPASRTDAEMPAVSVRPEVARKVRTVIIDAGHGGLDRGVAGRGGLLESELSLDVAKSLRNALAEAGYSVLLTREEDSANVAVADRAKLANDQRGDLLITLHAGSNFAPNAHGVEVFYPTFGVATDTESDTVARAHPYTDRSQRFAQILADTLRESASAEVRGVHGARLRLHRSVAMPGVLLEMGVLTNPADEALLEKDSYRQSIVAGIVGAVQKFNEETS